LWNLKYCRDFNHKNFLLPNFSGVIDTAETVSAVSMTPQKQLWGSGLKFQWCHIDFSGVIGTAETVSAVSLTPRKPIQRCQWHRWNRFSSIIDTAETLDLILIAVSAVSLTPLKRFQRCQWHSWNSATKNFCGWNPYDIFNFTIMVVSEALLIPLKRFQRCHWHRWIGFSGVIDTAETISVVSMAPKKQLWGSVDSLKEKETLW
jgi:hypothetical protein